MGKRQLGNDTWARVALSAQQDERSASLAQALTKATGIDDGRQNVDDKPGHAHPMIHLGHKKNKKKTIPNADCCGAVS